ncbi:hypothetical protein BHE74_00008654 [Ensete ventricosum]|nr:hypothetical protein GW17_00022396 [Ensete ventricosum]RWW82859.1 hypothetical protein BHE74_00008654 [Ensete ventricosum]RZR80206.1 hypothetical protein BHM03_00006155 [Ensete ventricosum]
MVQQRQVFCIYASNLASNESLGYQHIGAMYHREKILSASTRQSYGGDLIIQRYDWSDWRVGLLQYLYSLKGARQVKGESRVLIPCSRGGKVLIAKGTEEVENAEANSKYQDRVKGQRPRNFIRPVSMGFSSR